MARKLPQPAVLEIYYDRPCEKPVWFRFTAVKWDFTVDWGDGTTTTFRGDNTNGDGNSDSGEQKYQESYVYNYVKGMYCIRIYGNGELGYSGIIGFRFTVGFDSIITRVSTFGSTGVSSMERMFERSLYGPTVADLDTRGIKVMNSAFSGTSGYFDSLEKWDVSNVTDMGSMFNDCCNFNGPIGSWNTSNVSHMHSMFCRARTFNQDISTWNTGNVVNMDHMFMFAEAFNQPIGCWNTSNVITMNQMFYTACAFNQPIGNWNVCSVTQIGLMFDHAISFKQDLGSWEPQLMLFKTAYHTYYTKHAPNGSKFKKILVLLWFKCYFDKLPEDVGIPADTVENLHDCWRLLQGFDR
tara:strand:- start:3144 stop:4202 length:1059 start_codon:yes stop_codon:yes gene_type:complete